MKMRISGQKVSQVYDLINSEFGLQDVPRPNLVFGEGELFVDSPPVTRSFYNETRQVLFLSPTDLLTKPLEYQLGFSFEDTAMYSLAALYGVHVYSYLNDYKLDSKMEDLLRIIKTTDVKTAPETRAASLIAIERQEAVFGWLIKTYLEKTGKRYFWSIASELGEKHFIVPRISDARLKPFVGTEIGSFYQIKTTEDFRKLALIPFDEVSQEEIQRMKKLFA